MAIFGNIKIEEIVQVNDKTRIDVSDSFVSDEAAITLLEVQPEAAASFVDVTSLGHLDWAYSTDGDKVIGLRVTTDGLPQVFNSTLSIITAANDKLFSNDSQLTPYEPNLLQWVRSGRNSFIDVHRASQDRIIKYLDENAIWDQSGQPLTKEDVINISEFNDWSKFMTLKLIFEGLSNATDDIFHIKALRYKKMEFRMRDRAIIRVDLNGDGSLDANEGTETRSVKLLKV